MLFPPAIPEWPSTRQPAQYLQDGVSAGNFVTASREFVFPRERDLRAYEESLFDVNVADLIRQIRLAALSCMVFEQFIKPALERARS